MYHASPMDWQLTAGCVLQTKLNRTDKSVCQAALNPLSSCTNHSDKELVLLPPSHMHGELDSLL